jgi:hypothetical protein
MFLERLFYKLSVSVRFDFHVHRLFRLNAVAHDSEPLVAGKTVNLDITARFPMFIRSGLVPYAEIKAKR